MATLKRSYNDLHCKTGCDQRSMPQGFNATYPWFAVNGKPNKRTPDIDVGKMVSHWHYAMGFTSC